MFHANDATSELLVVDWTTGEVLSAELLVAVLRDALGWLAQVMDAGSTRPPKRKIASMLFK